MAYDTAFDERVAHPSMSKTWRRPPASCRSRYAGDHRLRARHPAQWRTEYETSPAPPEIERLNAELRNARQVAMDALVGKAKDQLAIEGKDAQLADLRSQIEKNVAQTATLSDAQRRKTRSCACKCRPCERKAEGVHPCAA